MALTQFMRRRVEGLGDISDVVRAYNRLVDDLVLVLEQFTGRPQNEYNEFVGVDLESGSIQMLEHGLDREAVGFIITRKDGFADIFWDDTAVIDLTKFAPLVTSTDVKVSVRVY